jgi:hypothetical protein
MKSITRYPVGTTDSGHGDVCSGGDESIVRLFLQDRLIIPSEALPVEAEDVAIPVSGDRHDIGQVPVASDDSRVLAFRLLDSYD